MRQAGKTPADADQFSTTRVSAVGVSGWGRSGKAHGGAGVSFIGRVKRP
jgi:hypothetical protein